MKKHLILPLTCLLLASCSTLSDPNLTGIQKAEKIANEDGQLIQSALSLVGAQAIQFAEQNPEKREDIAVDMERISVVVASAAAGEIDPKLITEKLRIEEPYVGQLLQSVAQLYRAGFERLGRSTDDKAAITRVSLKWLEIIARSAHQTAITLDPTLR